MQDSRRRAETTAGLPSIFLTPLPSSGWAAPLTLMSACDKREEKSYTPESVIEAFTNAYKKQSVQSSAIMQGS